jgi:hypothetical protein
MNIGDVFIYNGVSYTIWLIEDDVIHAQNGEFGICINRNEI